MEENFKTSSELYKYYNKLKYLVLFPDKKFKGYASLREISREIFIDYSTISKRLNETNPCICYSSNSLYLIQRINKDPFL
jgi:hypothetical protein